MNYRRAYIPGGTFFFTVVTHQRNPIFADPSQVSRLRDAFSHVRASRPFQIPAMVVMPDHLHALWTLPQSDGDYSTRWRLIKHYVKRGSTVPVWQKRYWEHAIRDEDDFARHFDYIHSNPVKHGLVQKPADWPHSSFQRCLKLGIYDADWCEIDPELDLD